MATIDWPSTGHFSPRTFTVGARVAKAAWSATFTGQRQSLSHLADRLYATLELRACTPVQGAEREAYLTDLVSAGHWVRLRHFLRAAPRGTLRGTPTVSTDAAAGARSFVLAGSAGATLLAGDVLGVAGQLLPVAYAGAVVGGGGTVSVPLQIPLRQALTAGASVGWSAPTGTFQLVPDSIDLTYGRAQWQQPLTLLFREVF